jgi:nitroreductase
MELMKAIEERRSIRKFTDYVPTDGEIRSIIEAARLSPSWANTQVWEFVVVRDRELIGRIAGTFSQNNPASKGAAACPVLIVACAKRGVSGCYSGREVTKFHEWFLFDLGMAVENICLRVHELGLGTVVVGLINHDACRELVGLPEGYEVVAVLPIGRPAVVRSSPGRKELESFVHLNRFGSPF